MRECAIPSCGLPAYCRGWCEGHYGRVRKTGDPRPGIPLIKRVAGSPTVRFWAKVDKNGPVPDYDPTLGPCWLWTTSANTRGYGQFRVGDRMVLVHRFSYELHVGPVPDHLQLDHLCRVRRCVRPEHLEAVTALVNHDRSKPFRRSLACGYGHEWTDENTYWHNGKRYCRQCNRRIQREWRAARLSRVR